MQNKGSRYLLSFKMVRKLKKQITRLDPVVFCAQGEERFILMGMSTQTRILTICHCERGSDVIRIISARKADKSERKQYEGYHHA